jgi:hypothetical protein
MNTKVVDLVTLNIFYKGYIGFSAQDWNYLNAKSECQPVLANSKICLATHFPSFSPQNLKCQST